MPTIAERLETATAQLEAQVSPLSTAVATCTTKATEASASATAAAGSASTATTKASDAETARAAAVTAKTAAETAQTATETAKTAAETAQSAAAGSATAAAGSATTASTHKDSAAASATAAAGSATTASGHATTATTKAGEAATSATAALASQNAAAGSSTNASTSANAAAASAAQAAAIAAGLNYKGTVAGASVAATSTAAGDCYLISSAGTSQTKTWAAGDLAVYRGTSGNWDQIGAVTVIALSSAIRNRSGRQPGIEFNEGGMSVGTLNGFSGSGQYAILLRLEPRDGVNNLQRILWAPADENATLNIRYNSTTLTFGASNTGLAYTAPDNEPALYLFVRNNTGSGGCTLYRNGLAVYTYTDNYSYSGGTYWLAGGAGTHAAGLSGVYANFGFAPFAVDATTALEIYNGGTIPERLKWSDNSDIGSAITCANGGGSGFGTFTGATTGGFTAAYSSGEQYAGKAFSSALGRQFRVGQILRVTFNLTVNSGATPNMIIWNNSSFSFTLNSGFVTIAPGANTVDFVITRKHNEGFIMFHLGTAGNFTVDSLVVKEVGFSHFYPMNDGVGFQAHDESTNKFDAAISTSKTRHLIPQRRGYVRGSLTWSGTHEAKSLLGQRAFPRGTVVDLITRRASASSSGPGCTIGATNDLTRWQAAAAFSTAKAVATLANRQATNDTDAHNDIVVDPDTANFTGTIELEAHYTVTESYPGI